MLSTRCRQTTRRLGVAILSVLGATLIASCAPDTVTEPEASPTNGRPVADAGPDLTLAAHDTVTLDGSASRDPDGDALTFRWTLVTRPAGSGAALNDPTAMYPSFVADMDGDFAVELVVSDGALDSTPDTVAMHADPVARIATSSVTVGAGLQRNGSATLGISDHGGVTVRIATSDSLLALVAPDANTAGSPFIDVAVADGDPTVPFVVQGAPSATGTATITITAADFTDGSAPLAVVMPAVAIRDLSGAQVLGRQTAFSVVVGLPDSTKTELMEAQGISAGHMPAPAVSVTSSNGGAGRVAAAGSAGDTIAVVLTPGTSEQEVTFEPLATGATVVAVSMPGFVTLSASSIDVTVDTRGMTAFSHTIGGGLQYGDGAHLDVTDHGGVTVRIASSDSTVALIAPDADTPGSEFLDVFVADGEDVAAYVVQGVVGATGTATVTASAPDFRDGTGTITVVQPALAIEGLAPAQSNGAEAQFAVVLGIPDAAGAVLLEAQETSAARATPWTATITSSDPAVGEMTAGDTASPTITVDVTAGTDRADIGFVSQATGTTTVSANIPGVVSTAAASVDVVVGGTAITPFSRAIGAGLQLEGTALLETGNHGGLTVHIESSDPTLALIAPDANTPGSGSLDVHVPDGDTFFTYVVQGVAGMTGRVTVTASAPGFGNGVGTIDVVQPALTIVGLVERAVVGSGNGLSMNSGDGFSVNIGVPDSPDSGEVAEFVQEVSAANVPPLDLTVTSSDGTVGEVTENGTTGAATLRALMPSTVTITLTPGMPPPSFTFTPLAVGTTTVSASIPGFLTTTGSVDVTVGADHYLTPFSGTIGAGLQNSRVTRDGVRLSTPDHGGVTVRIESSDPTVAVITDDLDVPGAAFVDVDVPDGEDRALYWVQGIAGMTGTVTVTASAAGFETGTGTIEVVQPAISIRSLPTAMSVGDDHDFWVYVGVPTPSGTDVSSLEVSAANPTPLVMTLSSSDPAVGHVTDGVSSDGTITLELTAGRTTTAATFLPLAVGTTTVSAGIPGFLRTTSASADVTVEPPALTSFVPHVGAGLETIVDVHLAGPTEHGGVTLRVESGDPGRALIAPDGTTPGSPFLDFEVPNGVTRLRYYLQGVAGNMGSVTITASAAGYTSVSNTTEVVEAGLSISTLPSSVSIPHDVNFFVNFGIPCTFGAESTICTYQFVSPANATPPMLTVTSSDGSVAHVTDGVSSGPTITMEVPPTSAVRVTFRPVAPGTTTVTASVPGFVSTTAATVDVAVSNQ